MMSVAVQWMGFARLEALHAAGGGGVGSPIGFERFAVAAEAIEGVAPQRGQVGAILVAQFVRPIRCSFSHVILILSALPRK